MALSIFFTRGGTMIEISDGEFRRIADYVKTNFGIHLNTEKKVLVAGRLSIVLQQLEMDNYSDYLDYIDADKSGQAARTFINKITTNHTFFMREADHFQYFRDRILPNVIHSTKEKDLRIWSAGCSTGEEPYTLAMLIDEYLGAEKMNWDTKLLATDISEQVLGFASRGIYENESLAPLPKKWRLSYFNQCGHTQYGVADKIKREVIFRRLNLMDSFPFRKKFHVIFCRNVMIYFDSATKMKLIQKFYDVLEPGGYLLIGHSESINREFTMFQYIMPAVYRKE